MENFNYLNIASQGIAKDKFQNLVYVARQRFSIQEKRTHKKALEDDKFYFEYLKYRYRKFIDSWT